MRTYLLFVGLLLAGELKAQPVVVPDSELATLVFFRERDPDPLSFTGRFRHNIYVDEEKVCKIGVRRYVIVRVEPGLVQLSTESRGQFRIRRTQVRIEAEAGQVYYIAGTAHATRDENLLLLHHVPEAVAQPLLTTMQPDRCMTRLPIKLAQR